MDELSRQTAAETTRACVRGELWSADGAVVGASITLLQGWDRPPAGLPADGLGTGDASRVSDAMGAFDFADLDSGHYTLMVEAEGFPLQLLDLELGQGCVEQRCIILGQGRTVQGRVLDPDGQPLAGMDIVASQTSERGLETCCTCSDATGKFELCSLNEGGLRLHGTDPRGGYCMLPGDRLREVQGDAEDVCITMHPCGRVSGWLMSITDGMPIIEATVHLEPEGREGMRLWTRTDTTGGFEFQLVPSGDYQLRACAAGFVPSNLQSLAVQSAQPTQVGLLMATGACIRGRVLDARGRPLSAVLIRLPEQAGEEQELLERVVRSSLLRCGRGPSSEALGGALSATCTEAGEFALDGLARGVNRLLVVAPGHAARVVKVVVRRGAALPPLDIELLLRAA